MSLIKWSPIRTLSNEYVDNNPYFEMNNLIKYIFDDTLDYDNSFSNWNPKVDIYSNDKEHEVNIETPGMKKNDFKINLNGNVLKVSGERKSRNSSVDYIESRNSVFSKTFRIDKKVLAKNIKADYDQGILKITVPKSKSSIVKNIEIPVK